MKIKMIKNEKGSTFVLVMMILIVFTLLATCILGLMSHSLDSTVDDRREQSAYYIAEAGLRQELLNIEDAIDAAKNDSTDSDSFFKDLDKSIVKTSYYDSFDEQYGETPKATIKVTKGAVSTTEGQTAVTYVIRSTGNFSDGSKKTVVNTYMVVYKAGTMKISAKYALYAKDTVKLANGSIIGDLGSDTEVIGGIDFTGGNPSVSGFIYAGKEEYFNILSWQKNNYHFISDAPEINYPMPIIEDAPDTMGYTLKPPVSSSANSGMEVIGNTYIPSLALKSNSTYVIKVPKYDTTDEKAVNTINIVIDELDLTGGKLLFECKDPITDLKEKMVKVNLYVTNHIWLSSSSALNCNKSGWDIDKKNEAMSHLDVYYYGPDKLSFNNDIGMCGDLYVTQADIVIDNGAVIHGNVVSGGANIVASGGTSTFAQMIYAPAAHVLMNGSGTFVGGVISQTCDMSGGAKIDYDSNASALVPIGSGTSTASVSSIKGKIKEE